MTDLRDELGSIEEGKLADLDRRLSDYRTLPNNRLQRTALRADAEPRRYHESFKLFLIPICGVIGAKTLLKSL